MNNTTVRILVGALGIPLILTLAIIGNNVFMVFCVIVAFFCMNEFYNLFEQPVTPPSFFTRWAGGVSFHKIIFLLISTSIVVCLYYEKFNYVFILFFIMFVYLIIDEVVKVEKHFEAIGSWMLSIIYISAPFGLLSLMDSTKFINLFGANYAIICMVMIWITDTFAFFGGKAFGRHKLAERISPKKTWEGSIIGFIFTIISGIALWYFFYPGAGLINMIIIGVIVGVFSQFGDLFESHLKRSVKVKDSSHMIPGHGGFLDRFDSILFAVPALYIYLYLKSTL